jgi:hypothetical protein
MSKEDDGGEQQQLKQRIGSAAPFANKELIAGLECQA